MQAAEQRGIFEAGKWEGRLDRAINSKFVNVF